MNLPKVSVVIREAGKAVGIKHATGEIIALIDSDDILPSENWLKRMVEPFEDEEISEAEPLFYERNIFWLMVMVMLGILIKLVATR